MLHGVFIFICSSGFLLAEDVRIGHARSLHVMMLLGNDMTLMNSPFPLRYTCTLIGVNEMDPTSQKRKINDEGAQDARFAKLQKKTTAPAITPAPETIRGQRLLTSVLHEQATQSPHEIYAVLPRDDNASGGEEFEEISFDRLANGVHRTTLWLEEQLHPGQSIIPGRLRLAYLGPSDIRYVLLLLAANELGHCRFFPSPHNAPSTQRDLYRSTGCVRFFCAASHVDGVVDVLARGDSSILVPDTGVLLLDPIVVPETRVLLDPARVSYQGGKKEWEVEKSKTFVILHTSGTTGIPKPIALPHSYYACEDVSGTLPYADALTTMVSLPGSRCLSLAPM